MLRPLIYLLYINNILQGGLQGSYTVFADDTIIIYGDITKEGLETKINTDINILAKWLWMNILTLKLENNIIFKQKKKAKLMYQGAGNFKNWFSAIHWNRINVE